jgi:hypothetical protein
MIAGVPETTVDQIQAYAEHPHNVCTEPLSMKVEISKRKVITDPVSKLFGECCRPCSNECPKFINRLKKGSFERRMGHCFSNPFVQGFTVLIEDLRESIYRRWHTLFEAGWSEHVICQNRHGFATNRIPERVYV